MPVKLSTWDNCTCERVRRYCTCNIHPIRANNRQHHFVGNNALWSLAVCSCELCNSIRTSVSEFLIAAHWDGKQFDYHIWNLSSNFSGDCVIRCESYHRCLYNRLIFCIRRFEYCVVADIISFKNTMSYAMRREMHESILHTKSGEICIVRIPNDADADADSMYSRCMCVMRTTSSLICCSVVRSKSDAHWKSCMRIRCIWVCTDYIGAEVCFIVRFIFSVCMLSGWMHIMKCNFASGSAMRFGIIEN